jgi:ribosome maturation factor RimP
VIKSDLINDIVSDFIGQSELFVVEVSVNPGNKILVLIDSMKGVSIGECTKLSRSIEQHLNRDLEDFELEVSSPGLSNPFRVVRQYIKNIGQEVEIILKTGQKITGKLISVENDSFCIEAQKKVKLEGKKRPELITEQLSFTFNEVKTTRIVINF